MCLRAVTCGKGMLSRSSARCYRAGRVAICQSAFWEWRRLKPAARGNPRPLRYRALKTKKKPEFRPENVQWQSEAIHTVGIRLAEFAGEAHGEPFVSRTPCAGQRHVCPRRASPCPNKASAGFARCRTGYFLQLFIRAALLAKFLSKPTHTCPNRILAVAYFPALHPPCRLPLYAGCFPKFCLPLLLHM